MAPSVRHIIEVLKPETGLEYTLLQTPEFVEGMYWGKPRYGHPEGEVLYHVREVLDNVDRLSKITLTERTKLRLVAITHDTFKFAEIKANPRDWNLHHGMVSRQFIQQYIEDSVIFRYSRASRRSLLLLAQFKIWKRL